MLGRTRPRLFTSPLVPNKRGLPSRFRTLGYELIRFAERIGEPFWPWQREAAIRALELGEDGHYRFRTVLVLVARQNGKTRFLRVLALWRLLDQACPLVVAASQDLSRAREVWDDAIETLRAHPDLSARLGRTSYRTNDEHFAIVDDEGRRTGRYRIKAATRSAGRGPSADLVPFDELREQTDWAGWAALSKTTMARRDGQLWAFSNAGDRRAVVLRHLRAVALAGTDPSVGILEWSAPPGSELTDREAWAHANPSLGLPDGVTDGAIRSALATDPPEIFRTEVLCEFVDVLDHAVDPDGWRDCSDRGAGWYRPDDVGCVDVAPDGAHVSLVTASVLTDGRVRLAVAAAWEHTRRATATERARAELPGLLQGLGLSRVGWFPSGPAKPLAPLLRPPEVKTRDGDRGKYVEIKGGKVAEACMGLADLVNARLILHPDDPLLTAHVTGAQKLPDGDQTWRFVRHAGGDVGVTAHVDAAYAAAGAAYIALTEPPEPPRERPRIITARA